MNTGSYSIINNANSSFKIYVLRLKNRKYYVGKTERPVNVRYNEHRDGTGSAWTKLYKPIEILHVETTSDLHREDNVTLEYMDEFGVENVRGGMYSQIELTLEQEDTIDRQNCSRKGLCFYCRKPGHLEGSCRHKKVTVTQSTSINPDTITIQQHQQKQKKITNPRNKKRSKENDNDEAFDRRNQILSSRSSTMYIPQERTYNNTERVTATESHFDSGCCLRCGRSNHVYEKCYASTDVNGCKLDAYDSGDDSEDYNITVVPTNRSSSFGAPKKKKKENTTATRNQKLSKSSSMYISRERTYSNTERATATTSHGDSGCCLRCGRSNHGYEKCYASTDVNGCKLDEYDSGTDSEDYNFTVVPTNRSSSVVAPKKKKKENTTATATTRKRTRTSTSTTKGCKRCGRSSHKVDKCYALSDVDGNILPDDFYDF